MATEQRGIPVPKTQNTPLSSKNIHTDGQPDHLRQGDQRLSDSPASHTLDCDGVQGGPGSCPSPTDGNYVGQIRRDSTFVLWAQSTTKDYRKAEHTLQSISKLLIPQVILPQVMWFLFVCWCLFIFRWHSTREPASSMVTNLILRAYTVTGVSHSQHRKKNWERLWKKKMQVNGQEG